MPASVSLNVSVSMAESIMLRRVGVSTHPIHKMVMNLWGHPDHHDSPQSISTDNIKGLGQICGVQANIFFLTILLELFSRDHVNCLLFGNYIGSLAGDLSQDVRQLSSTLACDG